MTIWNVCGTILHSQPLYRHPKHLKLRSGTDPQPTHVSNSISCLCFVSNLFYRKLFAFRRGSWYWNYSSSSSFWELFTFQTGYTDKARTITSVLDFKTGRGGGDIIMDVSFSLSENIDPPR
jgi:hypothetical protein